MSHAYESCLMRGKLSPRVVLSHGKPRSHSLVKIWHLSLYTLNESCSVHKCGSGPSQSHGTSENDSGHAYEWVMAQTWINFVTHVKDKSYMYVFGKRKHIHRTSAVWLSVLCIFHFIFVCSFVQVWSVWYKQVTMYEHSLCLSLCRLRRHSIIRAYGASSKTTGPFLTK